MPNLKIETIYNYFVALLFFLPSTILVSHYTYVLLGAIVILRYPKVKITNTLIIIIIIIALSFLNLMFRAYTHNFQNIGLDGLVPYSVLMLVSYLFALRINEKIIKFVLYFIILEIFIGIYERLTGITSISAEVRKALTGETPFGSNGLLYYSRVAGLSSNSSVFSFKIFSAIILLHFFHLKKVYYFSFLFVLFVGLFVTFNRTCIIASIAFFILLNKEFFYSYLDPLFRGIIKRKYLFLSILLLVGIVYLATKYELIANQMSRGQGTDTSGRPLIWKAFRAYISNHLYLGNGSIKIYLQNIGGYESVHAHNSFLELIASNGIFISSFYLILIFININRNNFIYIVPFIIGSLTQFFIFWGVSFWDITFFVVLLFRYNNNLLNSDRLYTQVKADN